MKSVDYMIDYLVKLGVTDAFGIPGGVILDFIYALDARKPEITPHLTYHEQGAIFAACGYAQVSGKLGVAYATRGPGITNMVTGIADAYFDSIPVLIVTAHSSLGNKTGMRIEMDQEMDPLPMMVGITKYAARVDSADEVCSELERACTAALTGRPGPVLLDFHTKVFREEIEDFDKRKREITAEKENEEISEIAETICNALSSARRPVLLIGDGIRQSDTITQLRVLTEKMQIPVISSRAGQDIIPDSPYYFGFIGSHGMRCGNFILSKTDLIIATGNRMSFPVESESFRPVVERARTIRIDVDEGEFNRKVPNCQTFHADLKRLMPCLSALNWKCSGWGEWITVCYEIRGAFFEHDINKPIACIARIIKEISKDFVLVCDVGNHEFWVSHAYSYAGATNRVLYSKSFGTLGCAISKAIGAYYSTGKPVVCFVGDQGIQMNIQELQTISANKLPICIVVLNNHSSGMIMEHEQARYGMHFLHTTEDSGYAELDLRGISTTYNIEYYYGDNHTIEQCIDLLKTISAPILLEIPFPPGISALPHLKLGDSCQNQFPYLEENLYQSINAL